MSDRDRSLEAIQLAVPVFDKVASRTRLLDALNWPREIEESFFAQGASALPDVKYEIDRARIEENIAALEGLAMTLDVGDPIQRWLVEVSRSYLDGNRLLLAIGTARFHEISVDLYGGPRSVFDKDSTNLDLAAHLEARLAGEMPVAHKKESAIDPKTFGRSLVHLADTIGMKIETVVDENVSAKVVAGSDRVRIRAGTNFRKVELEGLFVHEVETHALTAQNGAAQPLLKFLKSGGPRTTRTQEGLAVFAEFHAHALSVDRMHRIVRRVRLVEMAESGASFLELYRWLLEQGSAERDAYFDAARICRGGLLTGRAPFTKDSSYLAGFME
ncbi:MAG: tyrosine/phenylalanine carboxypeptidase domain-containing protein, partial [Polyangiales bacterium]